MPGLKLATGLGMMVLTIIIHALFMVGGVKVAKWQRSRFGDVGKEMVKAVQLSVLTVWMFLAIVLEAGLWALLYLFNPLIEALPDMETAFYFSMVTFTTLGFGDVVLTGPWRTLASIQAANGVIIFGWTTALIFYFIQYIYQKE
ncbi:MAG: two pore domain potassium channel family protein [Deltaproteobacteria bacterium]|nr:two pore domain potassium channel family protein [Deltaproteobacteria bacterium]